MRRFKVNCQANYIIDWVNWEIFDLSQDKQSSIVLHYFLAIYWGNFIIELHLSQMACSLMHSCTEAPTKACQIDWGASKKRVQMWDARNNWPIAR